MIPMNVSSKKLKKYSLFNFAANNQGYQCILLCREEEVAVVEVLVQQSQVVVVVIVGIAHIEIISDAFHHSMFRDVRTK